MRDVHSLHRRRSKKSRICFMVFFHVLQGALDSAFRFKSSVVCFCKCPQHVFPHLDNNIQIRDIASHSPIFDVFEKRVFYPDMVFGTKLSLVAKWLRIRGGLWDMLFTSCEDGDTLNRNWNRLHCQEQQNKTCLSKKWKAC